VTGAWLKCWSKQASDKWGRNQRVNNEEQKRASGSRSVFSSSVRRNNIGRLYGEIDDSSMYTSSSICLLYGP
jgi:hypothetical protein